MTSSSSSSSYSSLPYDILIVGFGSSALSLATTLHSANPRSTPKTIHLECQPEKSWAPGVSLPSAHMRTSFIDDLVTGNDPRSRYTFVNFLHVRGLLVDYTNLGRVQPSRELVKAYLKWCGEELIRTGGADVRFGWEVVRVEAVRADENSEIQSFKIVARENETREVKTWEARKVVCAMGVKLKIPGLLNSPHVRGSAVHAAEFREILERREKAGWTGRDIAVVGGGQHAAEVLEYLHEKHPRYKASLFMEERQFRADDDTAFTTSQIQTPHPIFPPELVRGNILHSNQPYPTADVSLLNTLYELQYNQRIPSIQNRHRDSAFQIYSNTSMTSVHRDPSGRVLLSFKSKQKEHQQSFDLVVAATGYERHNYNALLNPLNESLDGSVSVGRDYAINFRRGVVGKGCGIWVLGILGRESAEDDLDDALFRILTERSRRVIKSMFGSDLNKVKKEQASEIKCGKDVTSLEDQARL